MGLNISVSNKKANRNIHPPSCAGKSIPLAANASFTPFSISAMTAAPAKPFASVLATAPPRLMDNTCCCSLGRVTDEASFETAVSRPHSEDRRGEAIVVAFDKGMPKLLLDPSVKLDLSKRGTTSSKHNRIDRNIIVYLKLCH